MSSETRQARAELVAVARASFDAYNVGVGGFTWDGKPIPPWESLTPKIRRAWCAAIMGGIMYCNENQPKSDRDFMIANAKEIIDLVDWQMGHFVVGNSIMAEENDLYAKIVNEELKGQELLETVKQLTPEQITNLFTMFAIEIDNLCK